jgi:hypothetical protein
LRYSTHNISECLQIHGYPPYNLGHAHGMLSFTQWKRISTQQ